MIPIVTDNVDVERVSIYNAAVLATNPLNGVLSTRASTLTEAAGLPAQC